MKLTRLFLAGGFTAVLSAAGGEPAKPSPTLIDQQQSSKTVQVGEHDVVPLSVRLRFTTFIVLPHGEQILDFVCGDKDNFVVNGFPSTNFASVKPSKSLAQTNLNLITASGRIYSFVLSEGFGDRPDLKVFIERKDSWQTESNAPRFVAATELDNYRSQVELARTQAAAAKKEAAEELASKTAALTAEVSKLKSEMPAQLKFDYKYEDQPGFNVSAMYHDERMTYIKAAPQETPVLYEYKDNKLNLIEFRYDNGLYIVTKVLDRGVLSMGKKKLHFERKGS